ncbi:MAG: SPOR domain-containing protein [Desulfovibrionaceae bacterium]|nr:SPOR domain-containing protein [Desulfovibrionaceae bacterium]
MPGAFYRTPPANRRRERPRDDAPRSPGSENAAKRQISPIEQIRTPAPGKAQEHSAGTRSVWELRLTPSILVMAAVLTLVTLCFFFLSGLIIGRGSVPLTASPVLERLVPDADKPGDEEKAQEQILPQEDLRFMSNLKKDAPAESEAPASPGVKATADGAPPAKAQPAPPPDPGQYDFVLRVAAFKSEEQADALRASLEGAGMRTRMIKEKAQKGTWFFVQVHYRGTRDAMETMRETLGSFGIRDSIVTSATAVH